MCSSANRNSQIANPQSRSVLPPLDGAVRLNVGCGDCPHASYYNVDSQLLSSELRPHDIDWHFRWWEAHALRVASDSVDVVYASHILEHYPVLAAPEGTATASDALREWYRVLRPGGVLYVAVPSLEKILTEVDGSPRYGHRHDRWLLNLFGQPRPGMSHCWAYTLMSLHEALKHAGFDGKSIERFEPFMNKPDGQHDASGGTCDGLCISLNLKARKPAPAEPQSESPQ